MYSKELKHYFRKMVNTQAEIAKTCDNINECKWHCLYYLDGLNKAMLMTRQYDSYVATVTSESFGYIFRSIVEYRKGVH